MTRWSVGGIVLALAGCPAVRMQGSTTSTAASAPASTSSSSQPGDDRASGAGDDSMVMVPDVMGMTKNDAEAKLHAAGVRNVETDTSGSSNFAAALVCSEVPGGGHQNRVSLPVSLRYCDNSAAAPEQGPPSLIGLVPDEAKRVAKANGWPRDIVIREITDDPKCKLGTVCRTYPEHWEYHDGVELVLYVAAKVAITAPD